MRKNGEVKRIRSEVEIATDICGKCVQMWGISNVKLKAKFIQGIYEYITS